MPYRRRSRRRPRRRRRRINRRRYRRRRGANRFSGRQVIRRMPTALPDMIKTRMRYSFGVSTSSGQTQVFRGNSIADPNLTGVGHQPAYHDFYKQQYQRYYVVASSVRARFTQFLGGGALQMTVLPSLTDLSVAFPTSFTRQRELPRGKTRILSGNANSISIRHSSTTKKMWGFGYSKGLVSAPVDSDPADQWYWNVHIQSFSGSSPMGGYLQVDLVYDVLWYNKISAPPQD